MPAAKKGRSGQTSGLGLSEFLAREVPKSTARIKPAWESWPEVFRAEIREVLRRNDAGEGPRIAARVMALRAKEAYGIAASDNQVTLYAISLGRRGWVR